MLLGLRTVIHPAPDLAASRAWLTALVADASAALQRLVGAGATPRGDVQDVGDGIRVATAIEPGGSVFGVIEPPVALPGTPPEPPGPGR